MSKMSKREFVTLIDLIDAKIQLAFAERETDESGYTSRPSAEIERVENVTEEFRLLFVDR